ncbi:MAG TPA: tRNA (N6-isopentenyl adenosine(37)-C2)-methylthiotransferase MiaB [Clostridiales bacterium]|nr:tRNA (N6-isopentenyl adenosine(37)-C2)-methylthiotransferase MiaB [Clostridiales bacterium]
MTIPIIDACEIARQKEFIALIARLLAESSECSGQKWHYYIHTFGCQLNENDGEKLAGQLDQMGYAETDSPEEADLILLNTCTIRENAEDRLFGNLGRIKNLRRDKPGLVVILCGCMMKQPEHIERISRSFKFVDIVFGPQDIHRLPELLYQRLNGQKRIYEVGQEDPIAEGLPVHRARKFRALCSIMFGCNNFCTYCIVPYTRGRERSRQPSDILIELRQAAAAGYPEVLLLGQNVNSYGNDLRQSDGQSLNFAGLLTEAAKIPGLRRIRFMTSHPKDISEELLQIMGSRPAIAPHLHLPLQSGSNRVLQRMNRQYTRERYLEIIRQARRLIPGLSISTDLIVGFPGETEADFADTLALMDEVHFDSAFTFQYSKRGGTPAAAMPDQVSPEAVRERFGRLVELQDCHSLESNQKVIGSTEEILIEGTSATAADIFSGRTGSNRLVNFTIPARLDMPAEYRLPDGTISGASLEGRLAAVRLIRAKTFSLEGEMETLLL